MPHSMSGLKACSLAVILSSHCSSYVLLDGVQEERMKKALTVLGDNFNTIRTGRANPAILDRIMVSGRVGQQGSSPR